MLKLVLIMSHRLAQAYRNHSSLLCFVRFSNTRYDPFHIRLSMRLESRHPQSLVLPEP